MSYELKMRPTWTCDICGLQVEEPMNNNEGFAKVIPEHWSVWSKPYIRQLNPDGTATPVKPVHLCAVCTRKLTSEYYILKRENDPAHIKAKWAAFDAENDKILKAEAAFPKEAVDHLVRASSPKELTEKIKENIDRIDEVTTQAFGGAVKEFAEESMTLIDALNNLRDTMVEAILDASKEPKEHDDKIDAITYGAERLQKEDSDKAKTDPDGPNLNRDGR